MDALCHVQFWSAKRLKWPIVTRAHAPRHRVFEQPRDDGQSGRRFVPAFVVIVVCAGEIKGAGGEFDMNQV